MKYHISCTSEYIANVNNLKLCVYKSVLVERQFKLSTLMISVGQLKSCLHNCSQAIILV